VDVAVWGNVPCVSKIDTLDVSTICRLWMSLRGESYYGIGVVALSGNTGRTRMGGGSTEHVYACSGGVVVVALKDLVACEFSVRRPRGGRSVVLLSSFHPQFDDSNTSTRFVP